MKNFRVFLSENFQFLEVKFSIYLNRRVFVMYVPFIAYNENLLFLREKQVILCLKLAISYFVM